MDIDITHLKHSLIWQPVSMSIGSLGLSNLICHVLYGVLDWRAVALTTSFHFISIALDHYKDHLQSYKIAKQSRNQDALNIFQFTHWMIFLSALIAVTALTQCPLSTTVKTACFVAPALLWDFHIFEFTYKGRKEYVSVKRIPGIKPFLVGFIRGCGTYLVVESIMTPTYTYQPVYPWNPFQLIVWVMMDRSCYSFLLDIRDYDEDKRGSVRTLVVLLGSIPLSKLFLVVAHFITICIFHENLYIIGAALYAAALGLYLDHKSHGVWFDLSCHSLTFAVAGYFIVQLT
ncbi:hypothetical protein BGW36DRAFT_311623 [Talaromyces proteolyticus]|uniref:Uncharacterized protein n=1 Tax=Talaromyces proteolyticus TaxID=1131652 RepID=A0AAD4Q472_9EURO|nr:uncharacterized protein BGW36DRAFT_311623 [Talaromyces proteolyticus]KAH8705864.1 hypothetical protein BGW36DRAFT_311623 [Talaromyces proteolyticus]